MIEAILRRLVHPRPRYAKERAALRTAISKRQIESGQALCTIRGGVNRILGWDSFFDGGDWVELEMEARERRIAVKSVADLLHLLDVIDGATPF